MMKEIAFRILDRVTVNGLYNHAMTGTAVVINLAYCTEENAYYLLDDPIILELIRSDLERTEEGYKITTDKAKVSIITCDTPKDVYKQLINRLAQNDLNPFILYRKYREGYLTGNEMIDDVLSSVNIPDEDIDMMIEEIAKAERNHPDKRISIDIDILKGMDDAYKLLRENKEIRIKDTIIDLINDIIVRAYDTIIYPRGHTLAKIVEELINEEKGRLERLKKQENINNNSGQMQELEGESESTDKDEGKIDKPDREEENEGTEKKEDEQTPDNNNNDDTDSTDSNDNTAGSGPSSPSQYIYTIRLIVPYSLSRAELQDIISYIRDRYTGAKVEII